MSEETERLAAHLQKIMDEHPTWKAGMICRRADLSEAEFSRTIHGQGKFLTLHKLQRLAKGFNVPLIELIVASGYLPEDILEGGAEDTYKGQPLSEQEKNVIDAMRGSVLVEAPLKKKASG